MKDLYLEWGTDLSSNPSGDIALTNDVQQVNQRVIRRLLTNQGDYIWNLEYGTGLALFVGSTAAAPDIEAAIRSQLAFETSIPTMPSPGVTIQSLGAVVSALITYSDPFSGTLINLNVATE